MRLNRSVTTRLTNIRCAMLLLFLQPVAAFAQQAPAAAPSAKPVEPDAMGEVYFLDSSNQSLKLLPKDPAKVVTHHTGLLSAKGDIQIPGTASSFRLKSGKDVEFVVKCTNPETYHVYPFVRKGKNREAEVSKAKALINVTEQQVGPMTIVVSKYGESSYRFTMTAPEPGEYGFIVGWSVYHFGVDASEPGAR